MGKPHGWRSLVGYSPWSRKELDMTERLHFHFQTMVQVMKIMATYFRRSHAGTAILSAPNPPAGHCRLMPLLETPGHSQTNLGQSLVGSLLLSLGYWCTRFCLCPPRVYFPVLCNFWLLCGGVNGALLQEGLFHAQVCCASLQQPTADPHLHRRCSETVLSQSLWGLWVLVCIRFVWALWMSLVGMGFDSKCKFAPLTILLGLLCPWTLGIFSKLL